MYDTLKHEIYMTIKFNIIYITLSIIYNNLIHTVYIDFIQLFV
jgi:hypothetical protein